MTAERVLFIVGPTGIGKTQISLELAKRIDIEIVSADSRQIYRHMNIGTAKPSPSQLLAVPHHFIDTKSPNDYYSAGQFATEARQCIDQIFKRQRQPVVVGGSGLYIRALVDGLFEPQIADADVKASLKKRARREGTEAMYAILQQIDPDTAKRLQPTDSQRILRALEVFEITGEAFSKFLELKPVPAEFEPCFWGIDLDRDKLYERINARVDAMLDQGFLDEVRALQERGYGPELNALQSVGYKEAFLFLKDELSHEAMVNLMKQKSRNYAKRQLTWFRRDRRIQWLDLQEFEIVAGVAGHILDHFPHAMAAIRKIA
ncbi:tRNA (adenosine(37)-N6)-dimethylallyltransferase MiaA [bacterium]|nr:tRNA (adenosine(37)-N6)-dimethylallyltransferase MiaA [bacterium]